MERKAFLALRNPRWEKLFPEVDLEVELVPSNMPDFTTSKLLGVENVVISREICTNAFIDFRGYVDDDGNEIDGKNIDNRLELYSFPIVKRAIQQSLEVRNLEVVAGENFAASD